jgi:signal transduction histidine kinase/ligand-binding sensor domain-containing protein
MWFGTNEGLNKYDGYNFTVYKNNPKDTNSISNNAIQSIYEAKSGNLWIGTENGLNLYNRNNDQFTYKIKLSRSIITDFLELEDGRVFMTTRSDGLYLYDPKNDSVSSFLYDENDKFSLSSNGLNSILMDHNGNIWIGTSDGLNLSDTLNYEFISLKNDKKDKNTIFNNNIRTLYQDSKNRIWVGTNTGLSLLKYKKGAPEKCVFINYKHNPSNKESISDGAVLALTEDKYGRLWIGIESRGLDIIDLNTFEENNCVFHHYRYNPNDNTSLSYNSVYSIYKDRNGSIWLGTFGDGIDIYNKLIKNFTHYKQELNNPNSLSNNFVNSFFEEDDHLWIGTSGGLNLFDKKKKIFKYFVHDPNNNKSIGSNSVRVIKRDSKKNLWIGTWGGGLNLYNSKNNTFTRFKHDPNDNKSIGANNVFAIIEDRDGTLWIGTMGGGLNLFDYKSKTFKKYVNAADDEHTITDDWVRTLFENSYGEIWLSSSHTVELFDKKSERFIHFPHDRKNPKSISYDGANMFFEDSKKNLWIGTVGGLNVFHREDSTFSYYQQEDGLPNNQINGILEDDHGNLWISTNKGISKFINGINHPENPVFKNYDASDGLRVDEFRPRAFCKSKDGTMYFGGKNGFNAFHPDSIKENPHKPPVVITKFLLFNKNVPIGTKDSPLKKHISLLKEIILPYKHSVITFEYAALNFVSPEKNQYAFILEGFDKEWHYVGSKREATYTNLNPGTYTFRVKGSNNDGVWNEEGTSLKIIITPPFWKTIWFRLIIIILVMLAVYGIHFIRVRNILAYGLELENEVAKRTKELKKSNKELKEFAYIVSHDLKEPLRGIVQLTEWTLEDSHKKLEGKSKEYLNMLKEKTTHMNNMVQGILEYSRVGRTEDKEKKIDLNNLIKEAIELLSIPDNIKILIENKLPDYKADKTRMTQLFVNILSNAVKHINKPEGIIKIGCEEEENDWKFYISDNGCGIKEKYLEKIFRIFYTLETEPTEKGTGIGLTIVKKIIDLYKGRIWVESEIGKGTTFYFTLPRQYKNNSVK